MKQTETNTVTGIIIAIKINQEAKRKRGEILKLNRVRNK